MSAPTDKKSRAPGEFMFLSGGSEMGERIRGYEWGLTPLGPISGWPQSLRTAISLILNAQHPMWVGWGRDLTFFYNDAYISVLSLAKHPQALGKRAAEVWREIWDICGPLADKVLDRGEASFVNDVRLFMQRGDFLEETFFSFSYSPIRDESGDVGGLFCPSTDVTAKVLNTRRLRTLSELAVGSLVEKSAEGACAAAAAILAKNRDDIPFALFYLSGAETLHLQQSIALADGSAGFCPSTVRIAEQKNEPQFWPVAEVWQTMRSKTISLAGATGFPRGPADQVVKEAIVLPIISRGQERALGVLISGINPTHRLDDDYRAFFELVAGHIATAVQNARVAEEEKKRADILAELDRAKTTFFSNVSHELRTPLTLILGPLEDELRERGGSNDRLELAHRNSLRLLKLVNTLLDFSRIEAGRIEASFEPTDLAALSADLASVFRSGAERAGLRLIVNCPPLPEPVYIDRDMWEKIVFNLLSNALKFTFEGEIEIKLHLAADAKPPGIGGKASGNGDGLSLRRCACLSVRDTGTGIPAEELPRIFERFHRVRNARSRSHEGTGIGLALVQELARQHGGCVSVESTEGAGTTFTVWIPLGHAHLPKDRLGAARHLASTNAGATPFVEEALRWLPETSARFGELSGHAGDRPKGGDQGDNFPRGATAANARILLADDNSDMRDYVSRLLVASGFEVVAVENGEAALDAARADPPELVLSDVMMPVLDGFGLLRELRKDAKTGTIPIILMSARAGEGARVEGVEAGADDYLTKPFSARELIARVSTHLQLARIRREAAERIRNTLESITDGLHVVDASARFTYLNAAARRMMAENGMDPDAMIGQAFFEAFPEIHQMDAGLAFSKSLFERVPTQTDNFYAPWHRWFSVRHYPTEEGGVATFFQDITVRKHAEQALLEAKAAAESANRSKDRFLAALSHELRTPLTPVLMTVTMLQEDENLPVELREHFSMIQRNIALEVRLIDDLLDISAITAGKLRLHPQFCDSHLLIRQEVEMVQDSALDKEIEISCELKAEHSGLMADPVRFQQIVWNLVRNAVKFTPRGGKICVRTREFAADAGKVGLRLEVTDTGIGISPDLMESIFLPFEQGAAAGNPRFGGLGLGLAIARALVDLQGGKIAARSAGANRGSTFMVEFPEASRPLRDGSGGVTVGRNYQNAMAQNGGAKTSLKLRRILIVEDHAATLHALSSLLKRFGYQTVEATNVAEALERAAAHEFDLVISDLGLPDGTGLQLMQKLGSQYGLRGIALTGYGMDEDIARARQSGFLAHLIKPVQINEIRSLLASLG